MRCDRVQQFRLRQTVGKRTHIKLRHDGLNGTGQPRQQGLERRKSVHRLRYTRQSGSGTSAGLLHTTQHRKGQNDRPILIRLQRAT